MPGSGGGHDGTSGEGAKFYSDFNGRLPSNSYYKRGIATVFSDNEKSKFVSFNTDSDGISVAAGADNDSIKLLGQIALKSDLTKVAKIDRSTSSAWVGDEDRNMIFNCNFNSKTLIVTFADGKTVTFQGQ